MNAKDIREKILENKRTIERDSTINIAVGPDQVGLITRETNVEILLRRYADGGWKNATYAYMNDKMAIQLRDALITLFPVEKAKKLKH